MNNLRTRIEKIIYQVFSENNLDVVLDANVIIPHYIDSFEMMKVLVMLEENFDIEFTDYELLLENYETVDKIITIVGSKVSYE